MARREVILDTETTGLEPELGHRIIEIGCVELIDRTFTHNNFHVYLNPDRDIDAGALNVHGISRDFLADKPRFGEIVNAFLDYLTDATLIIHNAPFDIKFINHELKLQSIKPPIAIENQFKIIDTLEMARLRYPGQRNSLDALCKRHQVDNTARSLHGALLDATLLARVYLAMTGGQMTLFGAADALHNTNMELSQQTTLERRDYYVQQATTAETEAHENYLIELQKKTGHASIWEKIKQQEIK